MAVARPRLGRLPQRPRSRRPRRPRTAARRGSARSIRADTLGLLTREGWEALVDFGVTHGSSTCASSSRSTTTRRASSTSRSSTCRCSTDFDEETGARSRLTREAAPSHSAATELVYLRFLEHYRPRFVEAVAAVADAPAGAGRLPLPRPARTAPGSLAALLLRLAGVAIETIADDYALSARAPRSRGTTQWLASAESDEERARIERITRDAGARRCWPCSRRSTSATAAWSEYLLRRRADRRRRSPRRAAAAMTDAVRRDLRADRLREERGRRGARAPDPRRRRSRPTRRSSTAGCRSSRTSRPRPLVGIWELDHEASVAEYQALAHEAIDAALAAGRTPVVVGGTGLYFRAALAELDVPPAPEPGARERWERAVRRARARRRRTRSSPSAIPAAAAAVHPNDRRRVVRALELAEAGHSLRGDRLWAAETRHPTLVVGPRRPAGGAERADRGADARDVRRRASRTRSGSALARAAVVDRPEDHGPARGRGAAARPRRRPSSPRARAASPRTSGSGCAGSRASLACGPTGPRTRWRMRFSRWRAAGNEYLLAERAELGGPLTPERVRAGGRRAPTGSSRSSRPTDDGGRDRDLEPGRLDRRDVRERDADRRALARRADGRRRGARSGSARAR